MAARGELDEAPEQFRRALEELRRVGVRPEVVLEEAPAPQRLAPWAVALTADVLVDGEEVATGRFVVLHEPAGHEAWRGTFRVVTFVRVQMEPEMAADPLLPGVGWTWLEESLEQHGAAHVAAGGTVTRVASESFGAMAERPATAEMEVRASWTPLPPDDGAPATTGRPAPGPGDALGTHLQAWTELLCTAAGLPPLPDGVTPLPARRRVPRD